MFTVSHFVPKRLQFNIIESKRATGICIAHACKNRQGKAKSGFCYKHYHRYRCIIDPVGQRYYDFKKNALARGKEFTIRLEWFRSWCAANGYCLTKGNRGRNCTIDRIKNRYGYHEWNIQLKSNIANIRKYHGVDKHLTELPPEHEDYVPF